MEILKPITEMKKTILMNNKVGASKGLAFEMTL